MIELDINKRWLAGTDHHPKSQELFKSLADIDFKLGGDYFCWKNGGDGDNGEHLMYEMDIHFERLDEHKAAPPTKPGYYWLRHDYVDRSNQNVRMGTPQVAVVLLDYKPGSRKRGPEVEKILLVSYSGCRQPLSELTGEHCHWSEEIACPPLP